ncbi:MAG: stage III sporulation protein AC [Limnochordaceae bacterium]|nr:stage III sporulation protein AC [Limnochordaceae bacterium]
MDISLIYKIAGVGILISILNILLNRAGREELAQLVNLVGVILVLLWVVPLISQLFDRVQQAFRIL